MTLEGESKSVDLVFGIKAKLPRPKTDRPEESVDLVFGIKAKRGLFFALFAF